MYPNCLPAGMQLSTALDGVLRCERSTFGLCRSATLGFSQLYPQLSDGKHYYCNAGFIKGCTGHKNRVYPVILSKGCLIGELLRN
jgi:hypothetical protein